MQLFYVSFAYSLCCMVYNIVDTTKMIDCFYDVIDRSTLGSYADGVGLEDVTCLFFCETTAFDMIGIVGQINLCAMIDASVQLCFSYLNRRSKGLGFVLALWGSGASEGIFHVFPVRNAPSIFPSAQ